MSDLLDFGGGIPSISPNVNSQQATIDTNSSYEYTGAIEQTERLFTTRSRSINNLDGNGDRGERAYIKLMTADPIGSLNRHAEGSDAQPTSLGTASGGVLSDSINDARYKGYADFLITGVRCNLEEKLQVVEVFGDAEVSYYFGRQPITMNFTGLLVDSPDNNWFIEWIEMYTHVMRGTQLAKNYELIKIVLPNMTVVGTMTSTSWGQDAGRDVDIPFQFTFLAKQIIPQPVTMPGRPLTNDPVINWDLASSFMDQSSINSTKAKYGGLMDTISNPLSTVSDYASSMMGIGSSMSSFGSTPSNMVGPPSSLSSVSSSSVVNSPTGTDLFYNVSSNLTGIRASLFSPIYGVLSSLTKLIKGTSGGLGSVIGAFINPVTSTLRELRNISNQAIGVVNLITNSINSITNTARSVDRQLYSTLSLLSKTGGIIANAPESIASSIRNLVAAGQLPLTSRFLSGNTTTTLPNGTVINSKIALLNSGPKHTAQSGASI